MVIFILLFQVLTRFFITGGNIMKNIKILMSIFMMVLLSSMALSGCSYSFSSSSSHSEGTIERKFLAFGGEEKKTMKFSEGDVIVLDYKVTIDRGVLNIRIADPDGTELCNIALDKDSSDKVEIPVKKTGDHIIYVKGEDIDGSCNIKISNK